MRILTISRWELRKGGTDFDKKTIAFTAFLLVSIGILSLLLAQNGLHINDNIYKAAVTDPYIASVLETDDRFYVRVAAEDEARSLFYYEGYDLLIIGNAVTHHRKEKSIAALDALDRAVLRYDEARLLGYNDLNNTFPVWINVERLSREQVFQQPSLQKLPEFEKTPLEDAGQAPVMQTPVQGKTAQPARTPSFTELSGIKKGLPMKEQDLATPSHFNPPIPFKSVVMSFLFIFPLFFIAQLYSSSIMEERVKRKGELLLVSPAAPYEIVIGKLLPYLLISMLLTAGIIAYIGGTALMLHILLPVSLMFLSTAFLGAIIARSFKELTFVLIFLSVILSGYIFLPAMFSNIHAISIVSPVTLVVKLLENEMITLHEYLFSTTPFYLVSTLVFMFGIFIYREEDLFTQKPIKSKLADSLQVFIGKVPAPLFFLSIVMLPVVLLIQLMLIVLMFNIPLRYGIVAFIFLAAFVEEVVKSAGIYTVFSRDLKELTTRNALAAGILSGAGFFAGEKVLLLVVISSIAGSVFGSVMGIGLLVYPLMLHVTSTTAAALGMRYMGTGKYLLSVLIATLIHAAYNLYLVRGVIFG
ncbi:MAG: ABC transporter [Candidatus Methanoperedens sp.]|jgi:ABC-type Na+ efflux pump permease subunit|nr:ABC transporter [Candidatus Methanoperedens sp.]PKL54200.1 MAG: ABC transporter [Candidatus Methanoperedenaceae archaeon HGW-Methanoperedenaceae-1]